MINSWKQIIWESNLPSSSWCRWRILCRNIFFTWHKFSLFFFKLEKLVKMKHLLEIVFSRALILNSQNRFEFEIFTEFSWNLWKFHQRLPKNKAMSTFQMIQEMNLRYHSLKMNYFLVLFTLAKSLFLASRNLAVKVQNKIFNGALPLRKLSQLC